MTITPWGAPQSVRSDQRERIYAAMVTAVAERGYPATEVSDLVELAGVSSTSFFELFDDLLDCFVQTLEAIVALAGAAMAEELARDAPWDARLRRSFTALVDFIIAQPAAARLCLVDAYAAGPEAVARIDQLAQAAGRRAIAVLEESPDRAGIPPDVVAAVVGGGLRKVIQTRLHSGREHELPDLAPTLMDWALSYRTPPVPLRAAQPPDSTPRPLARDHDDPRQRIVDAVGEVVAAKGGSDLTVSEITAAAGITPSAFFEHFEDQRGASLAAFDDAVQRALEVTIPVYRGTRDWARGVHEGLRTLFAYLSLDATAARFAVQAAWGSPEMLTRFDATIVGFRALLAEGLRGRSKASGIVAEAIGSSILSLIPEETTRVSPGRLYELTPSASFLALAPAVGAIEACAVINGD